MSQARVRPGFRWSNKPKRAFGTKDSTPEPRCKPLYALDAGIAEPPDPVDAEPPLETPGSLPEFGSYCIRAQVDMYEGAYEVAHAVGWSTSPEIIQRTKDLCEARKDKKRDQRCGDPSVTFTKFQEKCKNPTVEFTRRPIPKKDV